MDICEHMEIVDADGQHVGTVEKLEGDRIKLVKKDSLDGHHFFLDKSQVANVEGIRSSCHRKHRRLQPKLFSLQNGDRSLAPNVSIARLAGLANERSKRNT